MTKHRLPQRKFQRCRDVRVKDAITLPQCILATLLVRNCHVLATSWQPKYILATVTFTHIICVCMSVSSSVYVRMCGCVLYVPIRTNMRFCAAALFCISFPPIGWLFPPSPDVAYKDRPAQNARAGDLFLVPHATDRSYVNCYLLC